MKQLVQILFLLCCFTMLFSCHKEEEISTTTVSDYDGNIYPIIKIGNQYWTQVNLRSRHYSNGEIIHDITCPNNDFDLVEKNGFLYSWSAVIHRDKSSENNPSRVQGICPKGWHVPSHSEWTQLFDYVSQQPEYLCSGLTRNIAKALASEEGWIEDHTYSCDIGDDKSTNNATGFSILPAGYGIVNSVVAQYGEEAHFWTCTEYSNEQYSVYDKVRSFELLSYGVSVYPREEDKNYCFSVRCVKD